MKLVGYQISSDLGTKANTKYIVSQAWKRMQVIRRLKALGACEADLLSVLRCQVLSVLQFAVPAWTTMITKAESNSIEQVQKTGLYLIYGARFRSYTWALHEANVKTQVEQKNKLVFQWDPWEQHGECWQQQVQTLAVLNPIFRCDRQKEWDNLWENRGCSMVNGVPREFPESTLCTPQGED